MTKSTGRIPSGDETANVFGADAPNAIPGARKRFEVIGGAEPMVKSPEWIAVERGVFAALGTVNLDYRSPKRLAEAAGIVADFVCAELKRCRDGEPVPDTRPSEVIVREMRDNDWPDRQSGNDT